MSFSTASMGGTGFKPIKKTDSVHSLRSTPRSKIFALISSSLGGELAGSPSCSHSRDLPPVSGRLGWTHSHHEGRNEDRPENPAVPLAAYLPQLQSLGYSFQALLASALHRQSELHKLIIEQLDPCNQAALAGHSVAPGAFQFQSKWQWHLLPSTVEGPGRTNPVAMEPSKSDPLASRQTLVSSCSSNSRCRH